MERTNSIVYKIADTAEEFEQIHRLNYETFVGEIPQHAINKEGLLIDKFHQQNQYAIAKQNNEVLGMLAFNPKRPFSLDLKVPNLDDFLPQGSDAIELRLLSIRPDKRGGTIFINLISKVAEWGATQNYTFEYIFISGTTRQLKLYTKLGFEPFYNLVGKEGAWYQPMRLDARKFFKQHGSKLKSS